MDVQSFAPEVLTWLSSADNDSLPSIEDDNCDCRVDNVNSDAQSDQSEQLLPEIITFYNLTKSGVYVVDELMGTYSVTRVSCRCLLRLFFTTLSDDNTGGPMKR